MVEAFVKEANATGSDPKNEDDDWHFKVAHNDVVSFICKGQPKVGKKTQLKADKFLMPPIEGEKVVWNIFGLTLENSSYKNPVIDITPPKAGIESVTCKIGHRKGVKQSINIVQAKIIDACFVDNNGIKIEKACWGQTVNIYLNTEYLIGEEINIEVWDDDTFFDDGVANKSIKSYDGKPISLKLDKNVKDKTGTLGELYVKVFAPKLTLLNQGKGFPGDGLIVEDVMSFSNAIIGEENGSKKHTLVDYDDVSWFYVNTTGIKGGTKLFIAVYQKLKGEKPEFLAKLENFTLCEDGVLKAKIDWKKVPKIKQVRVVYIQVKDEKYAVLYSANAAVDKALTTLQFSPTAVKMVENKAVVVVGTQALSIGGSQVCACKDYDLVWGGHPKINCDFRKKVVAISKRQNFDPNHLMAVIWVESAKTFSTSKIDLKVIGHNSKGKPIKDYVPLTNDEINKLPKDFSGAVGLIQFTPVAIDELNNYYNFSLTKRKLALMTQIEQLDYVEKYIEYWKNANKIKGKLTLADLYLMIFSPSKMNGSNDNTTLYKEGTTYYNANKSIDTDKKDGITKKELAHRAYESFELGSKKENKASVFSCGLNNEKTKKDNNLSGVLEEMKTIADSHKPYLQETDKNRTANTDAGLAKMDCSELVSRYLHKLGVTKNIIYMTTANMVSQTAFRKIIENDNIDFITDSDKKSFKPQKGDIFVWRKSGGSGHTGVVYEYDESKDIVTILEAIGSSGAVSEKDQVQNGGYSGKNCTRTAKYSRLKGALYGHDGWKGYFRPKNYNKKL